MSVANGSKPAPAKAAVYGMERASTIYFDGVHAFGEFNGSYQLELFSITNTAIDDGGVMRRRHAEVCLRTSRTGLMILMAAAKAALEAGDKNEEARSKAGAAAAPPPPKGKTKARAAAAQH